MRTTIINQIVSLYNFLMNANDFPLFKFTAPPFMEWVRGEGSCFLNGQTRLLSWHGCYSLATALQNLRSDRLSFGIMELFDMSIEQWNKRYGWSMVAQHRNQSDSQVALSEADRAELERLQADDCRLYCKAKKLFISYNSV